MIYVSDNQRHLVCYPFSENELHKMAHMFYIDAGWLHTKHLLHYDIPKHKSWEISEKTLIVSPKTIVRIIKGEHPFSFVEKAKGFAITSHGITNQFYDNKPYWFHLQMTVDVAMKYIHLIPEDERDNVIAGCWNHDNIENARQNWNYVKNFLNEKVANYSFYLQNNRGRDRQERADHSYYSSITNFQYALFIKLCDRIANATYSKSIGSSMYKKYQKELSEFYMNLYDGRYPEMWENLNILLYEKS
jgi:hypothetical protein